MTGRDGRVDEGGCLENSCGCQSPPGVRIPLPPPHILSRGGARVADWGRLLSGCRGSTSTAGSNPALPAGSARQKARALFFIPRVINSRVIK